MFRHRASSIGASRILGLDSAATARASAETIGAKAASLARMLQAGIPVPAGLVLTMDGWREGMSARLRRELRQGIASIERTTELELGSADRPLLLAVRCSPARAMPGLMPAVLNVGLNAGMIGSDEDEAMFRLDCLGRLICGMGEAMAGIGREVFERALGESLSADGPATLEGMRRAVQRLLEAWWGRAGQWPDDPMEQVERCIRAAWASWDSPVAAAHRRATGTNGGVAVIVQAMAFGNRCGSAVGRACTRDALGRAMVSGRVAAGAQGNDAWRESSVPVEEMPNVLRRLDRMRGLIERVAADACEVEFVAEGKRVWVLGCVPAARGPESAAAIAVDLARRGTITPHEAVRRMEVRDLERVLHPRFDESALPEAIAEGFGASPGAASGRLAFGAGEVERRAGERLILVRRETDAGDIAAMQKAAGVLTSTGGMTSHAAVVARGFGKPCVTGAADVHVDESRRRVTIDGREYGERDWLSIDGGRGEVYRGELPTVVPELPEAWRTILRWADGRRRLKVYANADTPEEARLAREFGAEGVGLCRTEHMFFAPARIGAMRRMILADDAASRQAALDELLPWQQEDFTGIFRAMDGLPVTIRLLDPPLHEFLPTREAEQRALAYSLGIDPDEVRRRVEQLREVNPMLGLRGCRLCVMYPEIGRMQVRAIIEAACACRREGVRIRPRILAPLVASAEEMAYVARLVREAAGEVMRRKGMRIRYEIGAMIEVPRAAIVAGEIAQHAEFFSFGTNDLTQMTLGVSRDDAGRFLPAYVGRILPADPFREIERDGVGLLMRMAVEAGRRVRPGMHCSACGEQAGEAASARFCDEIGLDAVSCSAYRVPVARLGSAHVGQ